jgi:CheY-like chemotaxis protein
VDLVDVIDTEATNGTSRALTILIVDDDPDMRYLARAVLESSGIRVADEASDGSEALIKFRALEPPPIPTVVLLDNQMPGPSGLEVATQILADTPSQLVVLFSAYLSDRIIAEATRVGVAACVSKVDAINLPDIIRAVVASASPPPGGPADDR